MHKYIYVLLIVLPFLRLCGPPTFVYYPTDEFVLA